MLADVEVEIASPKAKRDSWVPRSTMYPPSGAADGRTECAEADLAQLRRDSRQA